VVDAGGVAIDGGGGLGAEVAVAEVEVEGADVVGAAGAGELHASFDAGDGVMSLHNFSVVSSRGSDRHGGGAAKVMRGPGLESSKTGNRRTKSRVAIEIPCKALLCTCVQGVLRLRRHLRFAKVSARSG
jgi:hypothetical protein